MINDSCKNNLKIYYIHFVNILHKVRNTVMYCIYRLVTNISVTCEIYLKCMKTATYHRFLVDRVDREDGDVEVYNGGVPLILGRAVFVVLLEVPRQDVV